MRERSSGYAALLSCSFAALGLSVAPAFLTDAFASHFDRYELSAPRIDIIAHGRNLHAVDGTRMRSFRLMSRERVLWTGVADQLAVAAIGKQVGLVLTDRRLIGFSAQLGSLVEQSVGTHEDFFSARASFDFATVATSKRLRVFDGPQGSWQTRRLGLRQ